MLKIYKKSILTLALISLYVTAFAQIETPAPSPAGKVYSKVGLTDVTVDYFRPKMKGRKIFGSGSDFLVPFGQIWRTGANSGTKLSISTDAEIKGTKVPAGEYLIFTKPGASEWAIMLYKDLSIGGNTGAYDESKEQARFTVKSSKLSETVETLTFNISDLSEDNKSANIEMAWENTSVKLPIKVDFDDQVMKAIEANTKVDVRNLRTAANYYLQTGRDLDQALTWIDAYLEKYPKQFWNVHLKAQILKAKGDKAAAIETAKKSIQMAKEAGNDFGYIKRNEDLIAALQ